MLPLSYACNPPHRFEAIMIKKLEQNNHASNAMRLQEDKVTAEKQ
jgi:hypothetical protein